MAHKTIGKNATIAKRSKKVAPDRTYLNVSFTPPVLQALSKYCDSFGLPSEQDAVRICVAITLKREGFMK